MATMSSPVCRPSSTFGLPPAIVLSVATESDRWCFGVCSQVSPSSMMFWCWPRIQVAAWPAMMKLKWSELPFVSSMTRTHSVGWLKFSLMSFSLFCSHSASACISGVTSSPRSS